MIKESNLYRETRARIGDGEMATIDSLLREGHTGFAETQTVAKLVAYVRGLEEQMGINVEVEA